MKGKLRRKDVMRLFNVSRQTLDNAQSKGELAFNGGWFDKNQVLRWAAEKGHQPVGEIIEVQPSGGGLVDDQFLSMLGKVNIPPELHAAAGSVADATKSQISIIAAQEKQVKLMRDTGRLGDVDEMAAVMDSVITMLTNAAQKLPVEMAAEVARKNKLKAAVAKGVLEQVSVHMTEVYAAAIAELQSKVRAFQDEKSAELRQRARPK